MKKIILVPVYMQQKELTLEDLKNIKNVDKNSLSYKAFSGMVDSWYGIAIQAGKTHKEAIESTLDEMSNHYQ